MRALQCSWANITNEMKHIMRLERRRYLQMAVAAVLVPLANATEQVSAPVSQVIKIRLPAPSLSQGKHSMNDPQHDFDFFVGRWRIENQRLRHRLQQSDDWEHFEASQEMRLLPGGIGNYDDFLAPSWRPGFVGMSLRLFNPQTRLWSIYWLDNTNAGLDNAGRLMPPVVGKFENSIGIFECDDELDGKPIRVRYKWFDTNTETPRWEQAMSADQGKTWEVNWRMQMFRQ